MRSGDIPWSFEHEESFREIKRLIVTAVDLFVPDFAGAASGANPYYILPDACGYGVGAGLFQFGPRPDPK